MRTFLWVPLWVASAFAEAQAGPNAQAGQTLAIAACGACHQVMPEQPSPAPVYNPDEQVSVAAPSFAAISDKYAHRSSSLRRIIVNPPHPMREQNWDPADLETVIDFIQSLQPPVPIPRPDPVAP